jgi:hypothetical protein
VADEHGPRAHADDEVAFPMANVGEGFDVFRSIDAVFDRGRVSPGAAFGDCDGGSDSARSPRPCGRRDR